MKNLSEREATSFKRLHREKVALINREADFGELKRNTLRISKDVATKTNTLLAGNICNSNLFDTKNPTVKEKVKGMFKEQIQLAIKEEVDFIIAETFFPFDEALVAIEALKEYGKGTPSVVTLAAYLSDDQLGRVVTYDNVEITEAMKRMKIAGADVVGLKCHCGPDTILSYMERIKKSGLKVPLACVPLPYRTTPEEPTVMKLTDPIGGELVFPNNLECVQCSRDDIYKFGRRCVELGISYIGLCYGNTAAYTRTTEGLLQLRTFLLKWICIAYLVPTKMC